jgi:hypothetical protein
VRRRLPTRASSARRCGSWLWSAAHGYSLKNNRDECDRLLDQAAELLDQVDDEYPWGSCLRTPGYLEIQRTTCYGRMGLAA